MRDFFQSVTDTSDFSSANEAVTAMRAKKEKPKFSEEEKQFCMTKEKQFQA